jgi:hypothetical protein
VRARVGVDPAASTVILSDLTIPALRLHANEDAVPAMREAIAEALSSGPLVVRFDDLVALLSAHGFPPALPTPRPSTAPQAAATRSAVPECVLVPGALMGLECDAGVAFQVPDGTRYRFVDGQWCAAGVSASAAWEWIDAGELPVAFALIPEQSPWADALVGVIGSVANRRAQLVEAMSLAQRGTWWNPYTLSWWPAACEQAPLPDARDSLHLSRAPSLLAHDAALENRLVGLDGRVYARRKKPDQSAAWFVSNADGSWTELTAERSTMRNLEADARAREAAARVAASRAAWFARQVALRANPTASPCDRLASMRGLRPEYSGFRSSARESQPTSNPATR